MRVVVCSDERILGEGHHRLAESGAGRVKTLQGQQDDKRLRVGDFRVRFTDENGELHIHAVKNRKDAYR